MALLLTGFSRELNSSAYYLTTERHAAFWVLLLSFAIFVTIRTMKRRYFIAAGGIAGILVLHKASFMFVIWPILGLLFLVGRVEYMEKKKQLLNLVFMLLAFAVIAGGWMIRNYGQYGTFFLTLRGGNVLAIRAMYNRMNEDEFNGAFLYWTPDPLFKNLLKERYGADALKKGKVLGKLNRSNSGGYYRFGRHQRNKVVKKYGKDTPFTDAIVKRDALKRIKKAPWRHIRAMAPLFWRSIFVESGFEIRRPLQIAVQGQAMVSILLVTGFFIALIVALRRRQWALFGFLFPGLYLMALNVAVSHCLPRYNTPLIPVFIIAAVLLGTKTFSANLHRQLDKSKI